MDLHQARCADKLSPACEHTLPSSRAEMVIATIAETNVDLWQARSTMTKATCVSSLIRKAEYGDEHLWETWMFTKEGCFLV